MLEIFSPSNLLTLLMLVMLQAVLGFDNLLYISLESKNAPKEKQTYVRRMGIGLAIILRIGLLFLLMSVIQYFQDPLFGIGWKGVLTAKFNFHSIIVLFGGGFIIYTAVKEIWHLISHEDLNEESKKSRQKSSASVIFMIVVMNLVFSFDSILSAMALTSHIESYTAQMVLMGIAIVISGVLMMVLADRVSQFLQKNRMFEVLGLFVLFIVGIMLLSEGGELAHIFILDNPITPMNKTTFYFVLVILVIVDIVQSKYQKKIIAMEEQESQKRKALNLKNDNSGSEA